MISQIEFAPGWPGIPPRWTSSAKSGVGTAIGSDSRVWFTLSHGILNEIYYPRVDQACIRDMGLIVTNGIDFFSEEKRHARHEITCLADGVPAYRLTNTCLENRYRIEKEIISDPRRDVVLQRIRFFPLQGKMEDYHLYTLLAPHLGNHGAGNTAWVGEYKGNPMLFAERDGYALALASSAPWLNRSAGFVGFSDGWQDLTSHKRMTCSYLRAENGNTALAGEVDLQGSGSEFVIALGFGRNAAEAGCRALASLSDDFEQVQANYFADWKSWQKKILPLDKKSSDPKNIYRISTAVLHTHESKSLSGGTIASLSIPWGFSKGDNDLGGYHLVWPRDLVETAGGLLAAGAGDEAVGIIQYLQTTQEPDGHWPQNMWLDGTPYWNGVQMDEAAFPILLVDLALREKALDIHHQPRFWPMVQSAAGYLVRNGPVTQQDRWEEDPGYSPFTLAVEIAALLAAADLADLNQKPKIASYLRETADAWFARIDRWIYIKGSNLANEVGVEGYYVRIAPPEEADAASPAAGFVPIKNRPIGQSEKPVSQIVSPDALALVRFGLRKADDPRIINTVKVIDALLKIETPVGPVWHRYNGDGYGEHADGTPFDGTGLGRGWPLLTGERGHYELAAGRLASAKKLLHTLGAFANGSGLLPEQVWDSTGVPDRELFLGRPSGSAMPLVWAHAEYIKLLRSLHDGRIFDSPVQTVQRYLKEKPRDPFAIWRFNHKCRSIPTGKTLRLETLAQAIIHWSPDGWTTIRDVKTEEIGLGMHVADLPTEKMPAGATVSFTFYWPGNDYWEGVDFTIQIGGKND
ncbi:MAG TPA: glucan 1,4-alpha-glucosidase [Nitrospiria bacterium]|nr:glucan 1,4-alpha-glucosidase [Nitrospiria bacterium]